MGPAGGRSVRSGGPSVACTILGYTGLSHFIHEMSFLHPPPCTPYMVGTVKRNENYSLMHDLDMHKSVD